MHSNNMISSNGNGYHEQGVAFKAGRVSFLILILRVGEIISQ